MNRRIVRWGIIVLLSPLLGACVARVGPDYQRPESAAAAAWQASHSIALAPHGGKTENLADWWSRFNDSALDALLAAAQKHSGTLAQSAALIERSRAEAVAAGSAGLPNLDFIASYSQSAFTLGGPTQRRTQSVYGLQSSWEIDLFGGIARQQEGAQAKVQADVAAWHEARVSLAAEVASAYANYRFCEIQSAKSELDVNSRVESARLVGVAERAGLQSRSALTLAEAAAADARATLTRQRAQCELGIKGLVALTAMEERGLKELLALGGAAKLPRPQTFRIDALPARVITQRPDIAAAERRMAMASADIGEAEALKYPRLSISGSITPTRIQVGSGPTFSVDTWSIGPSLILPLADGGRREANVEAFRAAHAAAEADYRAKVRRAVREVEEALVNLASVDERQVEVAKSAQALRSHFDAAETRLRAGLGAAGDLEEARRQVLNANLALAGLELERLGAWVALYRAVGGGWDAATLETVSGMDKK